LFATKTLLQIKKVSREETDEGLEWKQITVPSLSTAVSEIYKMKQQQEEGGDCGYGHFNLNVPQLKARVFFVTRRAAIHLVPANLTVWMDTVTIPSRSDERLNSYTIGTLQRTKSAPLPPEGVYDLLDLFISNHSPSKTMAARKALGLSYSGDDKVIEECFRQTSLFEKLGPYPFKYVQTMLIQRRISQLYPPPYDPTVEAVLVSSSPIPTVELKTLSGFIEAPDEMKVSELEVVVREVISAWTHEGRLTAIQYIEHDDDDDDEDEEESDPDDYVPFNNYRLVDPNEGETLCDLFERANSSGYMLVFTFIK